MDLRQFPQSQRKKYRRQRGQTLVEFALVLPIMFTVVFGIIEFCFLFESIDTVNFAAREGARVGAEDQNAMADCAVLGSIFAATQNLNQVTVTRIVIFQVDSTGAITGAITGKKDVYAGIPAAQPPLAHLLQVQIPGTLPSILLYATTRPQTRILSESRSITAIAGKQGLSQQEFSQEPIKQS